MDIVNYSSLRNNLASVLDKVNDDHAPVVITRQNGKAAVIISLEDFKSYEETAYLMSSVKNAKRLNASVAQLEKKRGKPRKLIEE